MKRSALALAVAVVIGACSAGSPDAGDGSTASSTPDATEAPVGTVDSGATVMVAESDFGPIISDADGNVLYLFTPDEGGESTCYDACADSWPPLLGSPSPGDGVDESLLGTTERSDGSIQVTYAGWPLYYFAADAAAGDTNGQGLNSVWFVVSPDGEAITETG